MAARGVKCQVGQAGTPRQLESQQLRAGCERGDVHQQRFSQCVQILVLQLGAHNTPAMCCGRAVALAGRCRLSCVSKEEVLVMAS
jgi:hypothetical protein